jgi:EmrB/QacA subfamily drug resistance transporter
MMELTYDSPQGRWVVTGTVVGSAVAMLTGTVVNVALPSMGADLGASVADLQWIVNGYLLTLASLILIGGSLGDRFGRRKTYLAGVVLFTTATLLCAVAPTTELLIAARVLSGVGGALLVPGSLAILQSSFRPEDRSTAIGAWSGLTGIAVALGPPMGGLLVDTIGWRWIFVLPLPLAAFVLGVAARHIPESRDPDADGTVDYAGASLAVAFLALLTYPMISASEGGVGLVELGLFVAGLLALVLFLRVERSIENPMLPPGAFANRQFTAANLVTFVVYGALGGVFFLLVVQLQTSLGYSATAAGAAPIPVTIIMLTLSARVGRLAQRIGPRKPLTVGPIVTAAGMLLMSRIGPDSTYLSDVFPAVVVFGLGLALIVAPVTATALAAVDERHSGVASGVNNAVSRAAQLIAVAALPAIVGIGGSDYSDAQAFSESFGDAMVITAVVAAAGAAVSWFLISDDVLVDDESEPIYHCGAESTPQR